MSTLEPSLWKQRTKTIGTKRKTVRFFPGRRTPSPMGRRPAMPLRMLALLLLPVLAIFAGCAGDQSSTQNSRAAHISGEWILQIQGPDGSPTPAEYRVTFRSRGAQLAGVMSPSSERKPNSFTISGAISGNSVAFLVRAAGFEIGPFEGTIQSTDSMQGILKASLTNPQRNWKAHKLR